MLYPPFTSAIQTRLHAVVSMARKNKEVPTDKIEAVQADVKAYLHSLKVDLPVPNLTSFMTSGKGKIASSPSPEHVQPSMIVISIFIEPHDLCIQYHAFPLNGSYSPRVDSAFCELTGFPQRPYSVYDSLYQSFVQLPSFCCFGMGREEQLVLRPWSFTDQDCPGLTDLVGRMLNEEAVVKDLKGKRKALEWNEEDLGSSTPGASKHKKPRYMPEVTDPQVIDLTES
ncbi:hypothetical protein Hypma_001345 [Hypsizygus marmoreus]|uniref:Uncharacterized protein n=1 Tax=Hypsizygus marmoreus TaxID=39966 RepID=A0A369K142_HYPMA|nr:hypothetical protein Hypma_001345 [Hypsizygus marmoreus]